ncbi:MAG: hypothetical protein AAGN66_22080, partial [Acidobacteriota bacterium]
DHPWFIGSQFHPEYKSRPTEPHPLFVSFIRAALDEQKRRQSPERRQERQETPAVEVVA